MAVGLPAKTTYADGDVFSASDINDTNGTINITAAPFAAGKNKIINGDFRFNQRAFTSITTDNLYGFDRWQIFFADGTNTYSAETFTPGAAPVAGYEAINFARLVSTGQTLSSAGTWLRQKIEDVRTFAGQQVTVSFWAKAATGTPKIAVEMAQNFGSGGSSQVTSYAGQVTLSTSWARYSVSVAVPSISGKTIGTSSQIVLNLMCSAGSNFNARSGSLGIQSNTFDFWGVQVEAGSTATAFQTATGTIQGELAACQRYYWRTNATNSYSPHGQGGFVSSTVVNINLVHPVPMRVSPSSLDFSNVIVFTLADASFAVSALALSAPVSSGLISRVQATVSGGTAGTGAILANNNNSSGYVGLSAEL